jgi:outer membrane protein insertion porin family
MKRRPAPRLLATLLLATASLTPLPLFAQDAGLPAAEAEAAQKVTAIDIRYAGPQTIDRARIEGMLATRVGQNFSIDTTDADIRALIGSGEIDNARVLTEPFKGGLRVIYVVETRAALSALRFAGNTALDSRKLAEKVPLAVGDTVSEVKLLEGKQEIEKLYAGRGFSDIDVSYRVNNTDRAGFQEVVYTINEGAKSWIRDIRFEGVTSAKPGEIRRKLETKERNWLSWATGSGKIDPIKLESDKLKVARVLQDKGHMKAEVTDVRRERVNDKSVDLVFVVNEGPVFNVNSVGITGMSLFQPEDLMPEILLKGGQPYSGTSVAEDEKLIRDYYGSQGYADARVDTRLNPAGENAVDVVYAVTEGPKYFVGKVNITGNVKTKDKVARREVTLAPGDVFNTVELETSRKRLRNTGYFSQVDALPSDALEPGYRDVNISVVEQNTGSLVIGAGFSSIDSLVGYINVTQTNFDITDWPSFQGGGQKFNAGIRVGTERKDVSIGLEEPYFLDQRLALGGDIFYRDLGFVSPNDAYEQRNIGGSIRLRRPITDFTYAQAEYTAQQVTIHEIDPNASEAIRSEEGDYLQHKVEVSVVHDSRDDILIARRGGRYEASVFGSFGDVEAIGGEIGGVHFFQLPADLILSLQGRVSTVEGDDVPIFQRLFLGGANTLRGFDYRDVGPKDENGEPLGGQTSVFFSAEVTFPIIESVRGAAFYDVGAVGTDSFDFGGDINSNVGVGLRLFLPFGPLAVDFGIPVQSDEFNDSGGKFQFNVGYKF